MENTTYTEEETIPSESTPSERTPSERTPSERATSQNKTSKTNPLNPFANRFDDDFSSTTHELQRAGSSDGFVVFDSRGEEVSDGVLISNDSSRRPLWPDDSVEVIFESEVSSGMLRVFGCLANVIG